MTDTTLYTAEEAAPILGVAPATIRSWAARGLIEKQATRYGGNRPRPLYLLTTLTDVHKKRRRAA